MKRRLFGLVGVFVFYGCTPIPKFEEPLTLGGKVVPVDVLNQGARTFAMRCAACHGYNGAGDGPGSGSLAVKPTNFSEAEFRYSSTEGLPTDDDLARIIRHGVPNNGMPGWPGMPTDERHAVIQFIKTLAPQWRSSRSESSAEVKDVQGNS